MKKQVLALAGVVALSVSAAFAADDVAVRAENGWVRLVPPVAGNSAAYMVLHNSGAQDEVVAKAASPVAEHVEVHQTSHDNGVMKMSEVKGLRVPAGGEVTLQPGGYHVMLIGLKAPLQEAQSVPVTLSFESGAVLELSLPVRAMAGQGMQHHKH